MSVAKNWSFLLALLFAGCVAAASGGDDFSNNLFSDLAPLLALFGERVTMQFMSQSMGWADNVILAMAPLGIITAIISAIRVGGPSWLKAIIGRARENLAVAEADLMSSTSKEVCELWNGQEVVRCMGSAPITEFICLLPSSMEKSPNMRPNVKIGHLDPAIKGGYLQKIQLNIREDFRRWRDSHNPPSRREDTEKRQADSSPPEIVILRNKSAAAPNISLNSHNQTWRGELRAAAVFGTILQLGVLMYSGFATYYPTLKFPKDESPIDDYAFPCTAVGTLVLVAGMLLCAHVVESSTKEERCQAREGKRARLIWLQQTKTVSDQVFDSFAIFPQDDREVITTSRRVDNEDESVASAGKVSMSTTSADKATQAVVVQQVTENEPDRDNTSQTDKRTHTTNKRGHATVLELKAVLGAMVTLCGYIVQFIGLRGMHWSASIAQLGAVLVMTGLRALVRRGLAKPPRCERLPQGFELEWFVMMMLGNPDSQLWRHITSERGVKVVKDWRIVTGRSPERHEPLKAGEGEDLDNRNSEAHTAMTMRRDLGRLADWRGPASAEAISLARAIEVTMDALFGSSLTGQFTWSLRTHYAERDDQSVNFRLDQQNGTWKAYADEVEAALSLWLYSVNEQEQYQRRREQETEEDPGTKLPRDDAWLRAKGSPAKRSLRLLGSHAQSLHRDLWWWMPGEAIRVMEVEEDKDGKLEVENHRIVGYGSGVSSASQKPGSRTRYGSRELVKPSFDVTDKDTNGRRATNAHLAAESYHSLELLYAQDMFSAFMRAAAKTLTGPIGGSADIRPNGTSGTNAWQSFTLRNDQLSRMAQDIQSTGLGSLRDIYLGIIPPLSVEDKLPQADAIIELARQHGKRHEQLGHWEEAGDAYLWLFRTAKTFPEQSGFAAKATAVLLEYLRQVASAIQLRKAQRAEGDLEQLEDLKLSLEKELKPMVEEELKADVPGILLNLTRLYSQQGCFRKCNFVQKDTDGEDASDWGDASDGEITFEVGEDASDGEDTAYPEVFNFTELHRLAWSDRYGTVLSRELREEKSVNPKDIHDWTPLHYATAMGSVEATQELLQHRADVNARDLLEWTPLHYSCRRGTTRVIPSILREGADIHAQGRDGIAPLHCAAMNGNLEAVSSLLQAGAAIDVLDASGTTPLLWAAYKGHKGVVGYLWPDANKKLRDQNGRTALHLAAIAGKEEVVSQLVELGADKEARDRGGQTPLHCAAMNGYEVVARLLVVEAGADKDAKDDDGQTPLHFAVRNGHEVVARLLVVEAGADKDAKNNDNWTPLHCAAWDGHEVVARLLVELGADKEARDHDGETPLHFAALNGHDATVKLLVEAGADKEAIHRYGEHHAIARLLAVEADEVYPEAKLTQE